VPSTHETTDAGNALRFIDRHGKVLRYVAEWKQWIVWDGSRWCRDDLNYVVELAKVTARSIYGEAE
jgi:putative DNA primase/helicase